MNQLLFLFSFSWAIVLEHAKSVSLYCFGIERFRHLIELILYPVQMYLRNFAFLIIYFPVSLNIQ